MISKNMNTSGHSMALLNAAVCLSMLLASLILCSPVFGQNSPSLSAKLDRTTFSLSSAATLSITVNGSQSANINIPEVNNLIFHQRGQSTQVQNINGSLSSSITSTYLIQARKTGHYTLPAIRVKAKGHILKTEPLSFEVTNNTSSGQQKTTSASKSGGNGLDEIAFVIIDSHRDTAYLGEIIPAEIKAYFQQGLRVEIQNLPTLNGNGFVMSPMEEEPRQTVEAYNGKNYSVIAWKMAISPIKEGDYDLFTNLDAILLIPQRNTRSLFNDPFFNDDFFSGVFGGYQRKTVQLISPQQPIQVLPLPQSGKPEGFSGAIGTFDFEVSAVPTSSIEVGDPITLTIAISGKGNFDRVSAPALPSDNKWKTHSPSPDFTNDGNSYEGTKIFEQAVVAKDSKVEAIPSLTFSYFDTKKNSYITKSSTPLPLTFNNTPVEQVQSRRLTKQAEPPVSTELPKNNTRLPLASIRLQAGNFTPEIKPVYTRSWFMAVFGFSSMTLLVVLISTLRKRYLAKNNIMLEKRRINKLVAEKLFSLQQAIKDNSVHDFLPGCREVIQIHLGQLWQLEPSAITPVDLHKRLVPDSPLIAIFAAADQYVYGGGSLSTEEMNDYFTLLKKELEELS